MGMLQRAVRSAIATALSLVLANSAVTAADFPTELARARALRDIITGQEKADLLIRNIKIVDVYRDGVYPGSLLVSGGRIFAVNPEKATAKAEFDGQGLYAVPGLIDGHFHFESQLVTPTALAEAMVPRGVTTVFAEFLDLVSAAGDDGVKAARTLFDRHEELPYRIYPFAPGKKVRLDFVKEILDWDFVLGLGELNPSKLFDPNDEDLQKIAHARAKGKLISGHVGDVGPERENLFPALGTMDDHDSWSIGDIRNNLKIGLPSFLLYGLHGVDKIIPGIVNERVPTENIMMSTDNLSVEHMTKIGNLDAAVRESIAYGLDPIKAIKMASYNTAKHFKMEDRLGSLTPGRYADIVLVDNLRSFTPKFVFKGGELVARDGVLLKNARIDYSALVTKAAKGLDGFGERDLQIVPIERSADGTKAKVTVFNFYGFGPQGFSRDEWLPIRDGEIVAELNGEKLLRFAIVERFAGSGKRQIKTGYLRQFALNKGAVAIGFSAPRPNVIVLGTNTADMLAGMKEIDKALGGFAVVADGGVKQSLPMNIYGMMTTFSVEELVKRSQELDAALAPLGHVKSGTTVNSLLELFYLADRHGFLG